MKVKTVLQQSKEVPVIAETQVLVVGSGPAGIAAAVASARTGAKTILAERYGCFGGALTIGEVESYNWYFNEKTYTARGISQEIDERMEKMGGTQADERGIGNFLNPEVYKLMLDRWIEQEHITPLLHALAVDTLKERERVYGVVFESKSGRGAILADCVIDATGDGDVAALAGEGFSMGGTDERDVLPVTMVFGVSGVDVKCFRKYVQLHREMVKPETHGLKKIFLLAQQAGKWPYSREGGAWKTLTPSGDFTSLNITREFRINGVDVWDLTKAEIDGRRQAMQAVEVLREFGADQGFANCSLRSFAFQIGIRETRRIHCRYSISRSDILGQATFDDSIGVFTRFIDGEVISHDDSHFQIPYRTILPQHIRGLLVAGRCVGCEQNAIQTMRMMVCCATTGQAAGTAAGMAAQKGVLPDELDVKELQNQLISNGIKIR